MTVTGTTHGLARLHVAGAGEIRAYRCALRSVLRRRLDVRDGYRAPDVQRHQQLLGDGSAREGDTAGSRSRYSRRFRRQLSDIIMMAVAKDPAQRFQTADAFRNALSQVGAPAAVAVAARRNSSSAICRYAASGDVRPQPAPANASAGSGSVSRLCPHVATGAGRTPCWLDRGCRRIVVLVALFGGTQVYRSHKQNAAVEDSMPTSTTTTGGRFSRRPPIPLSRRRRRTLLHLMPGPTPRPAQRLSTPQCGSPAPQPVRIRLRLS